MSAKKLTPLSSALVVTLPIVLTACGGSGGSANVAAPKTGNNIGDATTTKLQYNQNNKSISEVKSLNTNTALTVNKNASGSSSATTKAATTSQTTVPGSFNSFETATRNNANSVISTTVGTSNSNLTVNNSVSTPNNPLVRNENKEVVSAGANSSANKSTTTSSTPTTTSSSTNNTASVEVSNVSPIVSTNVVANDSANSLVDTKIELDSGISSGYASINPSNIDVLAPSNVVATNTPVIINTQTTATAPVAVDGLKGSLSKATSVTWVNEATRGNYADNQKIFLHFYNSSNYDVKSRIDQDNRDNYTRNETRFLSYNALTPSASYNSLNRNTFLFENFYPVFSGEVYTSIGINDVQVKNFNGQGVKVAIIDGVVDENNRLFSKQPTRITYENDPVKTNDDIIESSSKTNHGTNVALVITGKSNSGYGLAPAAELGYITIPKLPVFEDLYQVAANYKATVVNNSYVFNNIPSEYLNYTSILAKLIEVTRDPQSPLFVFVTGNQATTVNNGVTTLDTARIMRSPSSTLVKLSEESQLRDNIIVVGGADIQVPADELAAYQEKVKQYEALAATVREKTAKPTLQATSRFIKKPIDVIPCGSTKYNCLVAMDYYFVTNDANKQEREYGVSFAAPQVTAATALVKQVYPWMSASNLKTTILTTATDVGAFGVDEEFGWGLLNTNRALKGPMQFAFGDFYVNLGTNTGNYYFANNIYGQGGLVISGDNNNKSGRLILTGKNTYKGDTSVNSGTFALAEGSSITSNLLINRDGTAYIKGATVGSGVTNNGILYGANATVKGNLYQNSGATLVLEADKALSVSGTAKLDGTVALDNSKNYISATRKVRPILRATKLTDNFKNHVANDQVSYDIYYDYSVNTVYADIYRKNASDTAKTLSSTELTSDADKALLNIGGSVIESFLTRVDNQLDNTIPIVVKPSRPRVPYNHPIVTLASNEVPSEDYPFVELSSDDTLSSVDVATSDESTLNVANTASENLATAIEIQNSDDATFKKYAYQASASSLSNSLNAQSANFKSVANNFLSSFNSDLGSVTDSVKSYVDVDFNDASWEKSSSNINGKFTQKTTTLGIFADRLDTRIGGAISIGLGSWKDNYQNESHAAVDTSAYGLTLAASRLFNNVNVTSNVGLNKYKLHSMRHVVNNDNTIKANYNALEYRASLGAGYKVDLAQGLNAELSANLTALRTVISGFTESGNNNTASLFAFKFDSQTLSNYYGTLGAGLNYNFDALGFKHGLKFGVNFTQALGDEKFELASSVNALSASPLSLNSVYEASVGYQVNLSKDLLLDITGKYAKSSSWTNKKGNVAITYKF